MTLSFEILLPSATYLRQGYVFTGCLSLILFTRGMADPPGHTIPGQTHPPGQAAPPPEMATAADCTHPTGIHSRYRPEQTPPLDGEPPCPPTDEEPPWMENHPPNGEPSPPDGEPPPPPPGSRLRHTVYDRPVRILLECILVFHIKSLNTSQCLAPIYLQFNRTCMHSKINHRRYY